MLPHRHLPTAWRPLLAVAVLAIWTTNPLQAADDPQYNLPDAVAGAMAPDAVMAKMETAVNPTTLKEFQLKNSSHYWLFGEDRRFPIRPNIVPKHWFEPGAANFRSFTGSARPGEFYVFQIGVLHADNGLIGTVDFEATLQLAGAKVEYLTQLDRSAGHPRIEHKEGHQLDVIWLGVHVPATAKKGTYRGQVQVQGTAERSLALTLKVDGAPLKEEGVDEAWRLARLKWLNSEIGSSEKVVTRPFTPIQVDEQHRTLDILGRRLTLGTSGIPTQFTSYFSASNTKIVKDGKAAFSSPPTLTSVSNGNTLELTGDRFKFTQITPVAVSWEANIWNGQCNAVVKGRLEFDGWMSLQITPSASGKPANGVLQLDDLILTLPYAEASATYAMGLGLKGGLRPDRHRWKWNPALHQDAVWLGSPDIGTMLRFKGPNFQRPLINAYYDFRPLNLPESWGAGDLSWQSSNGTVEFKARTGKLTAQGMPSKEPGSDLSGWFPTLAMDWYLTPFKPLDVKQHFSDRYYHAGQSAGVEDTKKLKAEGANIIEIHHNRLCNPYINYPYNDDSLKHLKDFVTQAHSDGMRVNLYYTTRELTQNLPEFFALKSMSGEIIQPRKEGVAWPVTNPNGPHPWLKEHVGNDIVPAWRENLKFPEYPQKLDLAVITTPDSRWNNFYLEGLDYLIKNAGIDGLYIDDTALDRKSMQRARRILDANGNTGRRVSMHSWNHHNGLAKWSNSAIAFMELFPYYDGLWYGEGFNANESPEYMLVEMSGIPFGLMSEMLDHPNPWHGMVFGMRTRWPWSGDPRPQWKLEDQFGIADSEFSGWWDPACPVKTDHPQIKASVFRREGKTLIALASWAPAATQVKLSVDWKLLGLAKERSSLWAPACQGIQPECVFAADATIPVMPGKGWLLIADEQPRQPSPPAAGNDPPKAQ